jgi:hypothetical protein
MSQILTVLFGLVPLLHLVCCLVWQLQRDGELSALLHMTMCLVSYVIVVTCYGCGWCVMVDLWGPAVPLLQQAAEKTPVGRLLNIQANNVQSRHGTLAFECSGQQPHILHLHDTPDITHAATQQLLLCLLRTAGPAGVPALQWSAAAHLAPARYTYYTHAAPPNNCNAHCTLQCNPLRCRAGLEYLRCSGQQPHILHLHEWQTAAVSLLYWEVYSALGLYRPRVVLTIHNLDNTGECRQDEFSYTGAAYNCYVCVILMLYRVTRDCVMVWFAVLGGVQRAGAVPAACGAHHPQPGQHGGVQAGRVQLHRCGI